MKKTPSPETAHAAWNQLCDDIREKLREKDLLEKDGASWREQREAIITSGAVRDERKIELVSVLDTKLSMLPYAHQSLDAEIAEILAKANALQSALSQEKDPLILRVKKELGDFCLKAARIFCECAELVDSVAPPLYSSNEFGRRAHELNRSLGHIATQGEMFSLEEWARAVDKLAADWTTHKAKLASALGA